LYCSLGPFSPVLLRALVPTQQAVLVALMRDFDLHRFGLVHRGPHLKLQATLINRRYLVLQGRAHPPGIAFDVETPARTALLFGALVIAGLTATLPSTERGSRAAFAKALLVGSLCALGLTIAAQPVVLAGQVWGLGLTASDELSLAAALVATSDFLVHGGGYALCAAAVWAASRVGHRRCKACDGRERHGVLCQTDRPP
jgi:hypothetical protein